MQETDRELIETVVDGEASEAEKAELTARLAASPETRAEYEAARDLVRHLDTYPLADAPGLRPEILAGLRGNVVPIASRRRRVVFGLTWAAAAALVVAIGVDQIQDRRLSPDEAAGTMTALSRELSSQTGAPFTWPVIGEARAEGTSLTARTAHQHIAVTVEPVSEGMTLHWQPERLKLETSAPGPRYDAVNSQQGFLSFGQPEDRATVIFRRVEGAAGTTSLHVDRGGRTVVATTIALK